MTPNMKPMFTVPLFTYAVPDWKARKRRVVAALPEPTDAYLAPSRDSYTDFFTGRGGSLPAYADAVIRSVSECLDDFRAAIGDDLAIDSMWFETSQRGNYHAAHNHGSVGYSAVLFVDYDPAQHRPTRFLSPFQNFHTGGLMEHVPAGVDEGTLLIFPAAIIHDTQINRSDKPRTIVSFNMAAAR